MWSIYEGNEVRKGDAPEGFPAQFRVCRMAKGAGYPVDSPTSSDLR